MALEARNGSLRGVGGHSSTHYSPPSGPPKSRLMNVHIHSPHPNICEGSSILLALWAQRSPHCPPHLWNGAISVVV